MQVQCSLCDKVEKLQDQAVEAKRLRNRRNYMYLCNTCYERISQKTKAHHATGKFRLYEEKKQNDSFI